MARAVEVRAVATTTGRIQLGAALLRQLGGSDSLGGIEVREANE